VSEAKAARAWLLLAGLAAVVLLLPIWSVAHFPSQDGPVHVENARLLLDYGRPEREVLRVFYERRFAPVPNWFSHAFLAAVLPIVGSAAADKLFLSLYVLALPLAFGYAVTAVRPDAWPRSLLVLPFVYNQFVFLGFYNLAFAAVPFFVVVGHWLRNDTSPRARSGVVLAVLLAWLYFCHLVVLALALATLGVLGVARSASEARGRPREALVRLVVLALACAPAVLLSALFLKSRGEVSYEPGAPFAVRLAELARLNELVSLDPRTAWLSTALVVVLLAAAVWLLIARRRRGETAAGDALLLVVGACLVVYFASRYTVLKSPGGSAGGGTIHDRVSLYVFLVLLLWIAGQPLSQRLERTLMAVTAAIALGALALCLPVLLELDRQTTEYLSAGALVPRDSALFSANFAPEGLDDSGGPLAFRVLPLLHAASWIAADRGAVDLLNYEADLGYFPMAFREGANPYRIMRTGLETVPPCVSLHRYDRMGPRPLDYILVWGASRADPRHPCTAAILAHLAANYERVFVSLPNGRAELYRQRAK
jgi:hypothetical protein